MSEDYNTLETEIDIMQLFRTLLRHWWVILLFTLLGGLVATGYVSFFKEDIYMTNSSMIVQVTNTSDSDYTNLITSQRLVETYAEITESNLIINQLIEDLNLSISSGQIRNMVTVTSVNDTSILRLNVTSSDPVLAQKIANQMVMIVKDMSSEFEGLENVELLDVAEVPTYPSGPNRSMHSAVGIVLGGMLGVGFVLIKEFLDKKIRNTSDLEQKLNLRVLGAITYYDMDEVL